MTAPADRGPGRPPIGPKIEVRLSPETLAKLDDEAERRGEKRAAVVRGIVELALDVRASKGTP